MKAELRAEEISNAALVERWLSGVVPVHQFVYHRPLEKTVFGRSSTDGGGWGTHFPTNPHSLTPNKKERTSDISVSY